MRGVKTRFAHLIVVSQNWRDALGKAMFFLPVLLFTFPLLATRVDDPVAKRHLACHSQH